MVDTNYKIQYDEILFRAKKMGLETVVTDKRLAMEFNWEAGVKVTHHHSRDYPKDGSDGYWIVSPARKLING
jgi:hypothetical protein